jgi:hypothetical protein
MSKLIEKSNKKMRSLVAMRRRKRERRKRMDKVNRTRDENGRVKVQYGE